MTQGKSQVKVLRINEFAKLCNTTPRTLRLYEQQGLIKPYSVDPQTKYRMYDARQAREFLKIKLLQQFDMSLKNIPKTLADKAIERTLELKLRMISELIEEKKKEYTFLTKVRSLLFEKDVSKYLAERWFGPYTLFCMRVKHADYNKMDDYLKEVINQAKSLQISCTDQQMAFYKTTAYEPRDTNIDVALICKQPNVTTQHKTLPNNFYFKSLPRTKALVYDYTGPFIYFSLIYQKLFNYIFENKISLVDHVFDIYHGNVQKKTSNYDSSALLAFPIEQSF